MRLVQFEIPGSGRRVGVVQGASVLDVTSVRPEWKHVVDVFHAAEAEGVRLSEAIRTAFEESRIPTLTYDSLWDAVPGGSQPYLHPPVDHADPHRVLITGTGLTHLGSMQSRHQMHTGAGTDPAPTAAAAPQTDSQRMFEMGLAGGKPEAGRRGIAPEWFYKGTGSNLRGPGETLELPGFALDGGEEAELVGCYIIDRQGRPRRLGFVLGNEWSDHATEKINYLYLAPSKLRQCAIGPELLVDFEFQEATLRCTIERDGETLYDSGPLLAGERNMCHSLANCEDHHFKYPQHRQPGDVHLHFFGTSKLSYSTRTWRYQPGDVVRIESPEFGKPLINLVVAGQDSLAQIQRVEPA